MDIKSLRYFTETVRLGSFTDAAKALGVTQSTISKMIRQLEDELGESLVLRDVRKLVLTDTGRVVYDRGREILLAMQRLEVEVRETQSVTRGTLSLGIPPMINLLFTDVLKQYREKHPRVQLMLHECTGQEVERRVRAGDLEAGMTILPVEDHADLATARVATHRVWALGAPALLNGEVKAITLRTLSQHPLVLLNDDFALTRLLRWHFGRMGLEPKVAAQSGQWDWTVAMARSGMGAALLPEPFIERINMSDLVCRPVTQPEVAWEVAMIWNTRHISHALHAWMDLCRTLLGGDWPPLSEEH